MLAAASPSAYLASPGSWLSSCLLSFVLNFLSSPFPGKERPQSMRTRHRGMAVFMSHKAVVALVLVACSSVIAQDPFITYNKSIPIGQSGFVRWDTNGFAGPVNLWLQQLAPNASSPQVPLDCTKPTQQHKATH